MKDLFVALKMSPGTDRWESFVYGESLDEVDSLVSAMQDQLSEGDVIALMSVDYISSIPENALHLRLMSDGRLHVVQRHGIAERFDSWIGFWSVNGDMSYMQLYICAGYESLRASVVEYLYNLAKTLKLSQIGKRRTSTPLLPKEDSISVEIIENFISGRDRHQILAVAKFSNYIDALKSSPRDWTVFDYVANYAVVDKVANPSRMASSMFGFIAKIDLDQCSAMLIELIPLHKLLKAIVDGK